ncbi:hypothetical protein [Mycobacteroides chelonae]
MVTPDRLAEQIVTKLDTSKLERTIKLMQQTMDTLVGKGLL